MLRWTTPKLPSPQPQAPEAEEKHRRKQPALIEEKETWREAAAHGAPHQRQRQACATKQRPAGVQLRSVVTAAAFYTTIRCGIGAFHHLRRHFLRLLLLELCAALTSLGRQHWVDFGSLLGIYRDGDLILHDNDVDLAVLDVDNWSTLMAELQALLPRYRMRLVVPSEAPASRFLRVYCPLAMADVFGASPVGADRLLVDCGHGSCTEIGRQAVLPTGVLEWRGSKVSVPADVSAALEQRYGSSWQVPRFGDKGADTVEGSKLYMKLFRLLSFAGIRI